LTLYLGKHTSSPFKKDLKHLAFTLWAYKFVAKMLKGKGYVLEVGCGDGFGSNMLAKSLKSLERTDYQDTFFLRQGN
jgi:protein-L-isoaspartate O-methyltransferase